MERELQRVIPGVFVHFKGQGVTHRRIPGKTHRAVLAERRRDFRTIWARACREAGVQRLRHDLRRTAGRAMEKAGVARSVAMKITGHKTEGIYKRYAIVSDADLKAATAKLAKGHTLWAQSGSGREGSRETIGESAA